MLARRKLAEVLGSVGDDVVEEREDDPTLRTPVNLDVELRSTTPEMSMDVDARRRWEIDIRGKEELTKTLDMMCDGFRQVG
jgi:hypothetical protein